MFYCLSCCRQHLISRHTSSFFCDAQSIFYYVDPWSEKQTSGKFSLCDLFWISPPEMNIPWNTFNAAELKSWWFWHLFVAYEEEVIFYHAWDVWLVRGVEKCPGVAAWVVAWEGMGCLAHLHARPRPGATIGEKGLVLVPRHPDSALGRKTLLGRGPVLGLGKAKGCPPCPPGPVTVTQKSFSNLLAALVLL